MTSTPAPRPLWLASDPDPVFGTFHATAAQPVGATAVLICPPWGWDEITSYAARRAWAERLAADGHPTLRIDLPGTGDSGGTPTDPDRVGAWVDAIVTGAAFLAARPGVQRVAMIGLGVSGLLAGRAISDGAPIDDLILWAAPARGRTFLREQRAFGAMQSSRFSLTGEPEPDLLAEGWLEVGGFVLSRETVDALAGIDLAAMPHGRLGRVLLLERDGMGHDRELEARLTALGASVTTAPGHGWTDMVFHPERYAAPLDVIDRVSAWLSGHPGDLGRSTPIREVVTTDDVELDVDGTAIREAPFAIERPFGQLFGLIAEPARVPSPATCAVFLNAGAIRRVGPNRMWVEASRRWAARGIPTVRVDLEGIGDSDGDPRRFYDVNNFYTDAYGAHVRAILDALEARGYGPRFVLVGLCAGAYWTFNTAAVDARVDSAIAINPRAMVWDPDLLTRREARKVERLLQLALWSRVVRGQVRPSRMLDVTRAVLSRSARKAIAAPRRARAQSAPTNAFDTTAGRLDATRATGSRILLAFSGDEPVHDELIAEGIVADLARWPNVELASIPGRDHTARPIVAQRAVHALLDGELDRVLATPEPGHEAERVHVRAEH